MPGRRVSTNRKPRHRRLWPLMFLPILGVVGGFYFGREQARLPFGIGRSDPMSSAILGLLAGCGAMVISASAVLAYRVAQRRFTIGAILITIAVIAVLLGWARANLF
jgi:hypothetical protein